MCAASNSRNYGNIAHSSPEKDTSCSGVEYLSDRLLNAFQTSAIFFNREGVVLRTNTMACQDLHVTPDIVGRKLADVISVIHNNENAVPELLSRFDDPRTEQVPLPDNTFIGVSKEVSNGKVAFFASGCISRLECGTFVFSFRNIAEERTNEYMVKMALSFSRIFPWFYDFERDAMVIDPRYYEYTGIPTKDYTMTLKEYFERLHPDDRQKTALALERQLSGEHYPYPVQFRLRFGDDTYEWFEAQSTYLGEVNGMPYRIVGICMSTQAHKDIEQALTDAKNKAEQSDMLKSAFLANMSHEIRTPLNAIVGFSTLLAGGDTEPGSEEAKEYAALIHKNCDHLLTLVSDILDLSRIETGTMEYRFSEHFLGRLLTEIYNKYVDSMPRGVEFSLSVPSEDVKITTDILRLRQVVEHLVGNAIKFTAKGRIDLGYSLSSDGESVRISVADTGRGIPAGQTEKIFERFYKVDSFVQGAGLGLSICKTITERLGGKITVTSRVGEGARFTLKLPIHPHNDNNL